MSNPTQTSDKTILDVTIIDGFGNQYRMECKKHHHRRQNLPPTAPEQSACVTYYRINDELVDLAVFRQALEICGETTVLMSSAKALIKQEASRRRKEATEKQEEAERAARKAAEDDDDR